MRGSIHMLLAGFLAFGLLAATDVASAAPRTGVKKPNRSRPDADRAYSLEDIMKEPEKYLEREVFFYCRFATTANLFKNVNTRFNSNEHANFAVWPDKTLLWEAEGRRNILPTLYVPKTRPELLDTLRDLKRYELVAVTGIVLNVYAKCPWILVTNIERVELPSDRLCEPVIEHMQNGHEALRANFGGVAARHYEQALQFGLPPEYRAKAYEQLAQAYLLDNQLDKARDYLRLAVESDRSDSLLHLALADVAVRIGDPGEALAHCEFAMERSGKHPQVYGLMGEARSMMGDYVKAFEDLNTAAGTPGITAREKAMINVRRARIYVRAGRYPDAARVYAALSEPGETLAGDAKIHNEIGLFYEMLYLDTADARYLDSAYAAYEEAAKLNRFDAAYLYNMAEVEFRRQKLSAAPDYALAKSLLERIHGLEPEFTPARILEGRILYAEGKAEEAEYRYQSVANQIGSDATALMALAEAYLDIGKNREAGAAIRRARTIQSWNPRVQALGRNLERAAALGEETAGMEKTYDEYPGYAPENDQNGQWREEAPSAGAAPAQPMEALSPAARRPAPANLAASNGGNLRGGGARLGDNGTIRPGPSNARREPQDIQTSARPAPAAGRRENAYPATEVRLPDHDANRVERFSLRPPAGQSVQQVGSESAAKAEPRQAPAPVPAPTPAPARQAPLNLGFTPRSENGVENANGFKAIPTDNFREEFDLDFETGFPGFSGISGVGEAYASLPAGNGGDWESDGAGSARALPAFSFEPDASPVIIPGFRAPGEAKRDMPVRNANLYRATGGDRHPAEIIEKEPVRPHPLPDASIMAVPGDGNVHRAEVRLPTSAQGVGMSSDYAPAP